MGFKKKGRDDEVERSEAYVHVSASAPSNESLTVSPAVKGGSLATPNAATRVNSDLESALRDVFTGASVGLLGDQLLERGLLSSDQLSVALDAQSRDGGPLCEALTTLNLLDESTIARAYAEGCSLAVAELRRESIDRVVLDLLDEGLARQNLAIPVSANESEVVLAVAEPSDELREVLARALARPLRFVVAPLSDVRWAIDTNYRTNAHVERLVQAFQSVEGQRKKVTTAVDVETSSDDAPVVQVVDSILTQAMRDRASDVHIEPSDDVIRIRFRIDGVLKEIMQLPAAIGPGLVSRIKVMANMNIVERRRPQDGQLAITLDGHEVDVRVSTVATIMGENCVLRILDKTKSVLHLKDLGMPDDTYETYSKLVRAPFGMVLCAGPTGSGKTTTLYATLSEVANHTVNVMTIEDPVEYVFPSINQIQTNEQAGLTFATGLKSILRQDPDAILVGEIRDVETTRVAVQSALTGHFVVSSLHATDSVSALHRFLDMGIESFLVASSVLGVVGQRLLRRICPSCKTPYEPTNDERNFYVEAGAPEKSVFYHGAGCNFCSGTGYKERIGVYELLVMTPEIKRLVVGWATQEELRALAVKQGMRTMRQEALNLVAADVTTISEVVRSVYTL